MNAGKPAGKGGHVEPLFGAVFIIGEAVHPTVAMETVCSVPAFDCIAADPHARTAEEETAFEDSAGGFLATSTGQH